MQLHATSADYGMNVHLFLHSLIPASIIAGPRWSRCCRGR
jgi:hypothetical protein